MESKFSVKDSIQIPAIMFPSFKSALAIQNGVERKLLFKTWGGLGDQICSEPTLRYALKAFKNCEISLASEAPELFSHLKFHEVFDLKKVRPISENYLNFETIVSPDNTNLVWQFFSHMLTNCVDFPSMCALRLQLPTNQKEVRLPDIDFKPDFDLDRCVIIHPGKHWQSKTFPKIFWDSVIHELLIKNFKPVLIGANPDENRGTVDVDAENCVDLRNKLSLLETISLLKKSKVLLTNDSAPLHMAVDSDCWIGFIATVKHPDFITHWRRGIWGYKMQNFGRENLFDITDMCPNKAEELNLEHLDPELLVSWLPDSKSYANWAMSKVING